jgi:spermidine synthase
LEDAKGWVTRKRKSLATDIESKQELFDIVVHDCFSGGAVPKHIFTLEFWDDLKTIMNPEGVIAVVSFFLALIFYVCRLRIWHRAAHFLFV